MPRGVQRVWTLTTDTYSMFELGVYMDGDAYERRGRQIHELNRHHVSIQSRTNKVD